MNKLIKGLGAAVTLMAAAAVHAAPMEWSDNYVNVEHISSGETLTWTHNLNDGGFNVGSDTITNYSLNLLVSDDLLDPIVGFKRWVPIFQSEWANVTQGGATTAFEVDLLDYIGISGTISGLASLNSDGFLNVSLTGTSGDFYFGGSRLTATGSTSVPEPSSLALLAAGMVGLGLARRRAKVKAA